MKTLLLCLMLSAACLSQNAATPAIVNSKSQSIEPEIQYVDSSSGPALWLTAGPLAVAANTSTRFMGEVAVPREGWIYYVSEVDHHGINAGNLQLTVSNPGSADLLCKGREEMLVQFGEGRPGWPRLDGYGYHVQKGDRLKLDVTLTNSKNPETKDVNITAVLWFQPIDSGSFRRDVRPLWFDTKGCGPSDYDLKPGKNIASGSFEIGVDGDLVALQGALRRFGQQLIVENHTRDEKFLDSSLNPVPLARPAEQTQWHLSKGDMVSISASYDNPGKKDLKNSASGIALGLFVPAEEH